MAIMPPERPSIVERLLSINAECFRNQSYEAAFYILNAALFAAVHAGGMADIDRVIAIAND